MKLPSSTFTSYHSYAVWLCFLEDEIKLGAFYDPRLLSDYGGPCFNHELAQLKQLNIRNEDNDLIAPWDLYNALKPGTLVLVDVTLHCFVNENRSGKRKVGIVFFLLILDVADFHLSSIKLPRIIYVSSITLKRQAKYVRSQLNLQRFIDVTMKTFSLRLSVHQRG